MRLVFAGLGSAFRRGHLPAATLLDASDVVGGADPVAARRAELSTVHPTAQLYDDALDMFAEVTADLAVIATGPAELPGLAAAALDRGMHVLCEKPVASTDDGLELLARACARRPGRALVTVHQYRFSPGWQVIARCARVARATRRPLLLDVHVERDGLDTTATTAWRSDLDRNGGLLADHAVHFVALSQDLGWRPEPLGAERVVDPAGQETVRALLDSPAGAMRIAATTTAGRRVTRIALHDHRRAVIWTNHDLVITATGRVLRRRRVPSLADRAHADALYVPLYREVARGLRDPAWRECRTVESLRVARAVVELSRHAARSDVPA